MTRTRTDHRPTLRVDWPSCKARGLCAELLPEHIVLDDWGYPVVDGPVARRAVKHAEEAVVSCPHQALRLVPAPQR
jgi:ferredoxin